MIGDLDKKRVHVAIMKKEWGLVEKILTGEKKIESRWYSNRSRPWDTIAAGDMVYFKNTGEPVSLVAKVASVKQFAHLSPTLVDQLLDRYGQDDGITKDQLPIFKARFRTKNYCLLIFLQSVHKVKPFHIDKRGFGAMAAWLTVECIDEIKLRVNTGKRMIK